ncbi:HU family DNA-binding protein [Ruminococcus sp. OA3]|uniref:HU family DNA-binding protein n=1 Tax=Ruminococcus sp. OA3 TaxID=2914164 RepID=UPI001F06008E|nr:HU family DNA-binding protein [Ruminococcus sp. OA3]MCH1982710.1 HU family DNA-binding protein [Ruminococcus sp. OA3]
MMENKTVFGDLINMVKKESGYYKQDIKPILKAFLKVIRAELQKGNRIYLREFVSRSIRRTSLNLQSILLSISMTEKSLIR